MAVGKNKKLGRKKGRKKVVDPFTKKDWYDVKAPNMFTNRDVCKTPVSRTAGTKTSTESLMGRVFEVSLADLNKDEALGYRKIKLIVQEIQGKSVLCNFYGMGFARDRLCALIKKWQTLIEASVDIKTTDGYSLRLFCIGFTNKRKNQQKKTCYAQSSKVRKIRARMVQIMEREAAKCDMKELVLKFIPEIIGKEIEKECQGIYPLKDVYIRKVKMLNQPKFDLAKLMELHEGGSTESGSKVKREIQEGTVDGLAGAGGRL